jgi:putative glutamine amidotransferase
VEGAEAANGHFMIGVQWHPEDLTDCEPCMRRLFESFIEASMEFKQSQAMISSVA